MCLVGGLRAGGASGSFREYFRFGTCPVPSIDWGVVGLIGGCQKASCTDLIMGWLVGVVKRRSGTTVIPGCLLVSCAGVVKERPVPPLRWACWGVPKWHAVPIKIPVCDWCCMGVAEATGPSNFFSTVAQPLSLWR
jgi:hypothetical protein